MNLAEKLDHIRDASKQRIPAEKREVMQRRTKELRNSGIMDRIIRIGDGMPPFTLPNQNGVIIDSADLLASGAVVLTVFRGHW